MGAARALAHGRSWCAERGEASRFAGRCARVRTRS
jgi:hypothetical protein